MRTAGSTQALFVEAIGALPETLGLHRKSKRSDDARHPSRMPLQGLDRQ